MSPKASKPPEKLDEALRQAVQAYIEEGYGGRVSQIGPIEIVQHKALAFDVVIRCVGRSSA